MVVVVKRRPWLALVVLVLIGINATMFVRAARSWRTDDELAAAIDSDIAPCEVVQIALERPRTAIVVDEIPVAPPAVTRGALILALAPKTSPPR